MDIVGYVLLGVHYWVINEYGLLIGSLTWLLNIVTGLFIFQRLLLKVRK